MPVQLAESPLTEFTLKGALVVTAVDVGADRVLLAAAVENAVFTTKLEGKQKEFDALVPLLGKPFLFELGRGGALTALHFPDEPSGLVVGLRQLFAGSLQGEVDARSRVSREEFDATGTWALGSAMGVVLFAVSLLVIALVWRTVNLSRAGFTGALD